MFSKEIILETDGSGLYEFTDRVNGIVSDSAIESGLCNLFLKHTSAGLIIQENADPSAKRDLEEWLRRFVPENQSYFRHTAEGPDDMPSHIRSVLTGCSLNIPILRGQLNLGTWQGVYLWEHRRSGHRRKVCVTIMS